ncbi:unnamed protein product, partial [Meganyctiphanes norvegica]
MMYLGNMVVAWMVAGSVLIFTSPSNALDLHVYPESFILPEETPTEMIVSLEFNMSYAVDRDLAESNAQMMVTVQSEGNWELIFDNPTVVFTANEVIGRVNKTIIFSGYYWGYNTLNFYLAVNNVSDSFLPGHLIKTGVQVKTDRAGKVIDILFIVVGTIFFLCLMVNMGMQLDLSIIFAVLKKPIGPLCGFISQFLFMPAFSYLIGWLFLPDPLHRLGLFTLGCCPGGAMSNFWTLMFNGDLNLSITMTFVSTLAAMGMMPIWLYTLGAKLLEDNDNLQVPFGNLVATLIFLTIPITIGIILKWKRPEWAPKAEKLMKPMTFCLIIFFLTVGTYNSYKVFLMMTKEMVICGLLISTSGYLCGALFAMLWCLGRPQIIAISIETAMQNGGVAFILLKISLPTPDSDLAGIPAGAAMFLTGPPIFLLYIFYAAARRFCSCCPDESKDEQDPDALKKHEKEQESQKETTKALLQNDKESIHLSNEKGELINFNKNIIVLDGLTKQKLIKENSISV